MSRWNSDLNTTHEFIQFIDFGLQNNLINKDETVVYILFIPESQHMWEIVIHSACCLFISWCICYFFIYNILYDILLDLCSLHVACHTCAMRFPSYHWFSLHTWHHIVVSFLSCRSDWNERLVHRLICLKTELPRSDTKLWFFLISGYTSCHIW